MDEHTWQQAIRANPNCLLTLGTYIDWLEEQDDPKAAPFRAMYDRYGTGLPTSGEWYDTWLRHLSYAPWSYTELYTGVPHAMRSQLANVFLAHEDKQDEFIQTMQ